MGNSAWHLISWHGVAQDSFSGGGRGQATLFSLRMQGSHQGPEVLTSCRETSPLRSEVMDLDMIFLAHHLFS